MTFGKNSLSSFIAEPEEESFRRAPEIEAPVVRREPRKVEIEEYKQGDEELIDQIEVEYDPVSYLHNGSLLYLSAEEKKQLGVRSPQKMKQVASNYLGKSDKTGMKYFRTIKFFYPPGYLAQGNDRSPDLTPEGIVALINYSNCPGEDKLAYLDQLRKTYQDWLRACGAIEQIDANGAITSQVIQLELAATRKQLFKLCRLCCESFVEEAMEFVDNFADSLPAKINNRISDRLTEQLGEEDDSN